MDIREGFGFLVRGLFNEPDDTALFGLVSRERPGSYVVENVTGNDLTFFATQEEALAIFRTDIYPFKGHPVQLAYFQFERARLNELTRNAEFLQRFRSSDSLVAILETDLGLAVIGPYTEGKGEYPLRGSSYFRNGLQAYKDYDEAVYTLLDRHRQGGNPTCWLAIVTVELLDILQT